jgi:hypothetical protein
MLRAAPRTLLLVLGLPHLTSSSHELAVGLARIATCGIGTLRPHTIGGRGGFAAGAAPSKFLKKVTWKTKPIRNWSNPLEHLVRAKVLRCKLGQGTIADLDRGAIIQAESRPIADRELQVPMLLVMTFS